MQAGKPTINGDGHGKIVYKWWIDQQAMFDCQRATHIFTSFRHIFTEVSPEWIKHALKHANMM